MDNRHDKIQKKMRVVHSCDAVEAVRTVSFSVEVPSASDPKKTYTISGTVLSGKIKCSCPGYQFRGTCKHLKVDVQQCGWQEVVGPEKQTQEQRDRCICPRCGGPTAESLRGDF